MSFIPLHVYSGYSYLLSSLTIEKIVKHCVNNNFKACTITDLNSFSSYIEFINECKKNNIKPILGLDLKIEDKLVTFIIKNDDGYKNLLYISKLYNLNQLTFKSIQGHTDNLITIFSHKNLELNSKFKKEDKIKFASDLNEFSSQFSEFIIGLEIYTTQEKNEIKDLKEFLLKRNYKIVPFPHFFYKKEEKLAYRIVNSIKNEETLNEDVNLENMNNYMFEEKEINELYEQSEIEQENELIKNINFNFIKPRGTLLKYCDNPDEVLKDLSLKMLKEKISIDEKYLNRLNYELSVIKQMNYSSYFLIVYDYVNFAKNKGIFVGPGRGSAGGSLVAYALNIITIDPLKEDLLFERFLNPGRNTMPDIDTDFEDERREEVFEYIKNKYGEDNVASILVTQKLKAKQSIRDVGRVFKIDDSYITQLTKAVDDNDTLEEAYKNSTKFKELLKQNYYLNIVKKAKLIQGLPRQPGTHPSGIIINNEKIENELPLYFDNNLKTSQIEKNDLETINFLKMDLLGIRNLTIIKKTLSLIHEVYETDEILTYETIPYLDKNAIKLIASGSTVGIFQLESKGMIDSIKTLKPTTFNDIISLISLYRPGPKQFIKNYALRKYGKEKITYPSKKIINILKPTFGIIVYQEQIMQIVRVLANYSYQQADLFRRAIAKKDESKLKELKKDFIEKTINNGNPKKEAEEIFDMIFKFANYGFNKSHAFAYAKLATSMAYLKYKYPYCFYLALLEYGDDGIATINEMKKAGIQFLGPSINKSPIRYQIKDGMIRIPLSAIKGVNNLTLNEIIKIRGNSKFNDFVDFYLKTYFLKIPDEMLKNLIKAGAFDEFGTRNTFINSIEELKSYAKLIIVNGKIDYFLLQPPLLKVIPDDNVGNYKNEIECLGYNFTSPLDNYFDYITKNKITYINEIKFGFNKVIGIIKKIKKIKTKNNKEMCFVLIEDNTSQIEITVFPDTFTKYKDKIINDKIIEVKGKYQSLTNKFVADEIKEL